MKRKIAAILAADVAGYSRLVAEAEEETLQRLGDYRQVFDDFVGRHGGRIFNTAGDAVMCEFDSAVECVRAAIDIQESLRTRNRALPADRRLQFRMGVTIGDVVERGGDLLGDGVNIAARLEGLAPPGGICVSRSVHEAVANKVSVPFRDIGEREVKNIPNPVHAFVVAWPGLEAEAGSEPPRRSEPASRRMWPWLAGAGGIAAAAAALAAVVLTPPPEPQAFLPGRTPPVPAEAPTPPEPSRAVLPAQAPLPPRPERIALPADPAEAYAMLARQGGVVPDPKTPAEHYHNARLHEARGDVVAARRAYHALASLGQERIDPHLRYSALLRVQDGRAGAREVYSELQREKPTRVAALTHALQFEGAERRDKIAAFAKQNPDYAPAHYLLAEEYGEDRIGGPQTIAERRTELEALKTFLKADADGRLAPFFLDHSVLAAWLDKARKRHAALETFLETMPTTPTVAFARSNVGWTVSVTPPEAATSLSYRIGDEGEIRGTGHLQGRDPRTGKPMPNLSFELPKDQGATTIHLTYEDANGRPAGPFPIAFEPKQALIGLQRDILDRMPGAWVSLRSAPRPALYVTHLISYRCALDKAIVALDEGPLDNELPLPPCNEKEPYAVPSDAKAFFTVPKETQTVSVQLFYADGTVSDVRTFKRE